MVSESIYVCYLLSSEVCRLCTTHDRPIISHTLKFLFVTLNSALPDSELISPISPIVYNKQTSHFIIQMYKLAALYTFILFKSFDNKCTHVHARQQDNVQTYPCTSCFLIAARGIIVHYNLYH